MINTPICFGEYPSISENARAENSCHDCPFLMECSQLKSPFSDLIEPFKNPDGKTYNGLKLMSQISGIPEDEVKAIWNQVKKEKDARKED